MPPPDDAALKRYKTAVDGFRQRLIGQPEAVEAILPHLSMWYAGIRPDGRPVANLLLLGPTGVGKTHTVEALAQALHGSARHYLRIDCGEYQQDHEVCKLIGAPPGYLGHKETMAVLDSRRLSQVESPYCSLRLVLFDEIEKAASTLHRLLLGVMDQATLRLGSQETVNFEGSIIFMTGNLGTRELAMAATGGVGFGGGQGFTLRTDARREIAIGAVRRHFSPEFMNRLDAVVCYQPLDRAALEKILERHLEEAAYRLWQGAQCQLIVVGEAREALLAEGSSAEWGAREIRRTVERRIMFPAGKLLAEIGHVEELTVCAPHGVVEIVAT